MQTVSVVKTGNWFIDEQLICCKNLKGLRTLMLYRCSITYGGIQAKDVRTDLDASDLSQDPTQNGANEIISSWNIAEFLPKVTQVLFEFIVTFCT